VDDHVAHEFKFGGVTEDYLGKGHEDTVAAT